MNRVNRLRRYRRFRQRAASRRLSMEPLESRSLLASVSGVVVYDWDADGVVRDILGRVANPDFELRDLRVYVDENASGDYTGGEPHAITGDDGKYTIEGLGAGTHTVALELNAGWEQVFPAGPADHSVTVGAADDVTKIDFGASRPAFVPFTSGNLLVTRASYVLDDLLLQYTPDGELVQALRVPGSENFSRVLVKDVVVDRLGNVQIFNDDQGFNAFDRLLTFDPAAESFSETSVPQWDMGSTYPTWGDVAAIDDYVFANEHRVTNGAADGVIRFNVNDLSYERFSTGFGVPHGLTIGRDGLLYTMERTQSADTTIDYTIVRAHDPQTMQLVRDFRVEEAIHDIVVDQRANLYALTDTGLKHYDQNGNLVKATIEVGGVAGDMYLSGDGTLWMASLHNVQTVDTDFNAASIQVFDIPGDVGRNALGFVTVIEPPIRAEVTEGLIHHWKFDETSGDVAHDSVGGNHATLNNWGAAEPSWSTGQRGGALHFGDANNYAITQSSIPALDQFTMAFWLKMNARDRNTNQVLLTPQVHNWIANDPPLGVSVAGGLHDPSQPMLRIWEHYTIAVDRVSQTGTIFRDGEEVASGGVNLSELTQRWVMGHNQDPGNHGYSLEGLMDDLRIYDRLLAADEAAVLAHRPSQPGYNPVLVAPATKFGSQPTGQFDTQTATVYVDPAETNWIAWNRFPDLRATGSSGEDEFVLGSPTPEVDDHFQLTVTNPAGDSLMVELDKNGVVGAPEGPQAVIYGDALTTPDVLRGDNLQSLSYFDEAGTHNALFSQAGEYRFDFAFQNIGSLASYPDVWLLMPDGTSPGPGARTSISGLKWHDLDGDGFREDGEQPLAGWTIFLDENDNGQLDTGEPSTVTDADGIYELDNLTPGFHTIAEVPQTGWSPSYPVNGFRRVVQAHAGQPAIHIDFGNKKDNIPLTPGNLLVTWGTFSQNDLLIEYTPIGEVVQAWVIPRSESFSRIIAKDLVIDSLGRVQIYNDGMGDGVRLTTYDPATDSFAHTMVPDWGIHSTYGHWGDIAAFGDFVFANEHDSVYGSADGVIRFHVDDLSYQRYSDDFGSAGDLTIGRDGLLYLFGRPSSTTTVRAYDPETMQAQRTFTVNGSVRSAAVDEAGNIYALTDTGLKHFDPNGQFVKGTLLAGGDDIYLAGDGRLILADSLHVQTIDTDFTAATTLDIPGNAGNSAAGFATVVEPPLSDQPPTTFIVTELEPTSSGFVAHFNRPFDAAVMNLYDVEGMVFGPADATLVGDATGAVTGSLVLGSDSATFVATNGPLPEDTYTVALRSAANGFRDPATGDLLDGDRNGTAGDDYVGSFTIDTVHPVIVSLPHFVRGPEQAVNVPADGDGLPLVVNDADGIWLMEVTLTYDPALLSFTDVSAGPGMPGDAQVTANVVAADQIEISFFSPTPLPAGRAELITLTAEVPDSATYGAAQLLSLSDLAINQGAIPATPVDAVHVAALFGDTTANGTYSGLDAQRIARVAVDLDEGFEAFPTIDPILPGDITGNGELSGLDGQRVARESVGLDVPEIPDLPGQGPTSDLPARLIDFPGARPRAATRVEAQPAADLKQAATDPDTTKGAIRATPSDIRVLSAELAELLFGFGQHGTIRSDVPAAGYRGPLDLTLWDDVDLVADLARHALSERVRIRGASPLDAVPIGRERAMVRGYEFTPLRDDQLSREAFGRWDEELGSVR